MDRMNSPLVSKRSVIAVLVLLFVLEMVGSRMGYADTRRCVVIVAFSDSGFQQKTALRIKQKIDAAGVRSEIISPDQIAIVPPDQQTLYVAIGEDAIETLDLFDPNAMVLRVNNAEIPALHYSSTQADLITSQPTCKDLQLIKAMDAKWTTIGVLYSRNSAITAAELVGCAVRYDLNLQLYAITDETDLLKSLQTAVENNHILLAIVDPLIYNSRTVKNVLLTSYRHRKPVIGYSESFVQAGAIAAVYTSPEIAGDDAADIVIAFFANNWQFRRKRYTPSGFSLGTNRQVGTSLDISLPDDEAIIETIRRLEAEP